MVHGVAVGGPSLFPSEPWGIKLSWGSYSGDCLLAQRPLSRGGGGGGSVDSDPQSDPKEVPTPILSLWGSVRPRGFCPSWVTPSLIVGFEDPFTRRPTGTSHQHPTPVT